MPRGSAHRQTVLALVQVAMIAAVLTELSATITLPKVVAASLFASVVVLSLRHLGRTAWFMVGLCGAATAMLFATGTANAALIASAGQRGAFLASLILCLSFLRAASAGSPLIAACSKILVRQPPRRRYFALLSGGHFLGVIMNFGVLNLLGPLVMKNDAPSPAELVVRRRMMLAVIRGFSLAMLWAPTTLAQALIVEAVPGLEWTEMLPLTLGAALICAILGSLLEKTQPPCDILPHDEQVACFSYRPVIALWCLIAVFLAVVVGVSRGSDLSLIYAILPVAPLFSLAWIAFDARARGARGASVETGQSLMSIVRSFPLQGNEIVLLGGAGYLGAIVAASLGPGLLESFGVLTDLPDAVMAIGMMLVVALAAQVGINPVVSVSITGGILAAMPTLPVAPEVLGLALALGWAISHGSSPFSAAALIAGRNMGLPAWEVGYQYNGWYSLCFVAVSAAILGCVTIFIQGI